MTVDKGNKGAVVSRAVQKALCNAMVREELNPVAGTTVVTEEKEVQRLRLAGTAAEKPYMEREWTALLFQATLHIEKRQLCDDMRAVHRVQPSHKHQCKADVLQTAALHKSSDWTYVLDQKSMESLTRRATLAEEGLEETCAFAESEGETLPWRECLPKGIRESKHMEQYLKRWGLCGDKAGELYG